MDGAGLAAGMMGWRWRSIGLVEVSRGSVITGAVRFFSFFFPDLVVYVREGGGLSRMDEVVHSECIPRQKLRGRWKAVGAQWFVQAT